MVAAVAAVGLGVVFLVAGISKRSDPTWLAEAAELGTPRWVAWILPFVELVLGAVLITGVDRPVAAWTAAAVLAAFTVLLVVRLAQGRHPPCACFGARSAMPIGPWSVVRNLLLLALAVIAALA